LSISTVRQPDGCYAIGIVRDISGRRQMELSLRRLSEAVQHTSSTVVITDPEGKIEYVNPRFTATTGYSPEEVIGKNPRILKSGETPAEEYRKLWDTILAGKEWTGEFHNRRKDGSLYWELASIAPVKDAAGRIQSLVAVKEDITKRKRMEMALKQRTRSLLETQKELTCLNKRLEERVRERTGEIEHLLEQKNQFISQLGHDLRTPLTPLLSLLPLAIETAPDPETRRMLEMCLENSQYMFRLAVRTLELCHLNTRKLQLKLERTDIRALADDAARMLAGIQCGSAQIENRIPAFEACVDPIRMKEVFVNLLDNASKFGNGRGSIRMDALISADRALVSITDEGIGMSPDQLFRAFDEFYKAEESRHDRGSTGLGLAICRRIVERHYGKIWADSPGLGQGTTIRFTLPLA
jgi:PAS domain S-box-containing protein